MKIVFIFIFFTIYNFLCIKSSNTTISGNGTEAPFGTITGYASTNVEAYSNGNDSYISGDYYFLYGVYVGMKWQCVEYARRWLFQRKGCVFDSIEGAADMWTDLTYVQRVVDQKCFPLKNYPNGFPSPPINESLLIYNRSGTDMPFGHVAIIVDVLPNFIRVAEENYDSYYWSGNYSRQIQYTLRDGNYYIEDDYPILGWMIIDDKNQTNPLDQTTIDQIIKLNGSSPNFICSNNTMDSSTTISLQTTINSTTTIYPNTTVHSHTTIRRNNTIYPNNAIQHFSSISFYFISIYFFLFIF